MISRMMLAFLTVLLITSLSDARPRRYAPTTPTRKYTTSNQSFSAPMQGDISNTSTEEVNEGLHEVNAARAARGLPPYIQDPQLTIAARLAAKFRARNRIAGHVGGQMGDFAFVPAGTVSTAAGCGALEPSWGWGSCCTYDRYTYAGAAWVMGADGKRYMHLFVR